MNETTQIAARRPELPADAEPETVKDDFDWESLDRWEWEGGAVVVDDDG